jgi:hypothetical protein
VRGLGEVDAAVGLNERLQVLQTFRDGRVVHSDTGFEQRADDERRNPGLLWRRPTAVVGLRGPQELDGAGCGFVDGRRCSGDHDRVHVHTSDGGQQQSRFQKRVTSQHGFSSRWDADTSRRPVS